MLTAPRGSAREPTMPICESRADDMKSKGSEPLRHLDACDMRAAHLVPSYGKGCVLCEMGCSNMLSSAT